MYHVARYRCTQYIRVHCHQLINKVCARGFCTPSSHFSCALIFRWPGSFTRQMLHRHLRRSHRRKFVLQEQQILRAQLLLPRRRFVALLHRRRRCCCRHRQWLPVVRALDVRRHWSQHQEARRNPLPLRLLFPLSDSDWSVFCAFASSPTALLSRCTANRGASHRAFYHTACKATWTYKGVGVGTEYLVQARTGTSSTGCTFCRAPGWTVMVWYRGGNLSAQCTVYAEEQESCSTL